MERPQKSATTVPQTENQQFYEDVLRGLSGQPKKLPSKYFYDAAGDKLFQDIMASPDYYLTSCEMEIFTQQVTALVEIINQDAAPFNLVELGPGDCTKSVHLLRELMRQGIPFTYVPIDISPNVLQLLARTLPAELPGLKMSGMVGDYFDMLDQISLLQNGRNVVLCLGANIGNMPPEDCSNFCNKLRSHLSSGDMLVVGFDLKKDPRVVQLAYSDRAGITRAFNLNLLQRMNRELHTDFVIRDFEHYAHYDPETGASKSYLVCLKDTEVHCADHTINFKKDECIWMEISQKYTLDQVNELAIANDFVPTAHFMDSRHWFTDAIWIAR